MVIFSHRGIGFGGKENSLEAISSAVKKGFSVEIDLRLKDNNIILSHDEVKDTGEPTEFGRLLKLIKENAKIFFALHLKEDSQDLFEEAADSIRTFQNCFIFATDFKQDNLILNISKRIGKEKIALYATDKNIDLGLADKAGYFWLDETKGKIYNSLDYFLSFGKKVIWCSPELYSSQAKGSLHFFKKNIIKNIDMIFGICTDFAEQF